MGEEVKLIGSIQSLFSFRIEWALRLKGVEYEYIIEDVRNKSPLIFKYNPVHKKVPVLVHGDKPLPESLVILEYIEEKWKDKPLLPEDPYERAMARFWAKYADEKCLIAVWQAYMTEGEEKEKAMGPALESLAILEEEIKGKKFFGGEKMGFLDLVVGWIPHWLNVLEEVGGMKLLDAERFPSLLEWSENFIQTRNGRSESVAEIRIEWDRTLKGVASEYLEEDLRNKSPMLLQYTWYTRRSECLCTMTDYAQSLVILEYIDETWKVYSLAP